jgi:RNA polymerase sigma-70 factor (ECF subfamily)
MIMSSDSDHSTLRTRASLLFRLRNWEDAKSWGEFYGLYRKLVYGFSRRAGLTHEEAEEVTQDVFTRVAKTIQDFESNPDRGSFRGWLMQLTRWRVTDKFRSRPDLPKPHRRPDGEQSAAGTMTISRIPNPAQDQKIWDIEWRNQLLEAAMERLSRRVKAKHFQIFDFHIRQHWPVARISRELGVNPAFVYLITHRLSKQLKEEVAKLKATLG